MTTPHQQTDTPDEKPTTRWGKIRWGLAALLLGLPLPVVLIAFLMPSCGGRY